MQVDGSVQGSGRIPGPQDGRPPGRQEGPAHAPQTPGGTPEGEGKADDKGRMVQDVRRPVVPGGQEDARSDEGLRVVDGLPVRIEEGGLRESERPVGRLGSVPPEEARHDPGVALGKDDRPGSNALQTEVEDRQRPRQAQRTQTPEETVPPLFHGDDSAGRGPIIGRFGPKDGILSPLPGNEELPHGVGEKSLPAPGACLRFGHELGHGRATGAFR